jgi:hypothetical protein
MPGLVGRIAACRKLELQPLGVWTQGHCQMIQCLPALVKRALMQAGSCCVCLRLLFAGCWCACLRLPRHESCKPKHDDKEMIAITDVVGCFCSRLRRRRRNQQAATTSKHSKNQHKHSKNQQEPANTATTSAHNNEQHKHSAGLQPVPQQMRMNQRCRKDSESSKVSQGRSKVNIAHSHSHIHTHTHTHTSTHTHTHTHTCTHTHAPVQTGIFGNRSPSSSRNLNTAGSCTSYQLSS